MNLPEIPQKGTRVLHFAKQAVAWMRANTITNVVGGRIKRGPSGTTIEITPSADSSKYVHPWRVAAKGDDVVTIAPGEILSMTDGLGSAGGLTVSHSKGYAGGDLTITTTGYIYGSIDAALSYDLITTNGWTDSGGDTVTTAYLWVLPDVTASISIGNAATMPISTAVFYWEIAQVDLTDGVASITKQVLTHNPILWSFAPVV